MREQMKKNMKRRRRRRKKEAKCMKRKAEKSRKKKAVNYMRRKEENCIKRTLWVCRLSSDVDRGHIEQSAWNSDIRNPTHRRHCLRQGIDYRCDCFDDH